MLLGTAALGFTCRRLHVYMCHSPVEGCPAILLRTDFHLRTYARPLHAVRPRGIRLRTCSKACFSLLLIYIWVRFSSTCTARHMRFRAPHHVHTLRRRATCAFLSRAAYQTSIPLGICSRVVLTDFSRLLSIHAHSMAMGKCLPWNGIFASVSRTCSHLRTCNLLARGACRCATLPSSCSQQP